MLENKTPYFLKLRNTPTMFLPILTIEPITEKLEALNINVLALDRKLEKNSLPSFDSKISKQKEIFDLRNEIQKLIKETENEINSFSTFEPHITESIRLYLFNSLRTILTNYKSAEQKNLVQVDQSIKTYDYGNEMMQETMQRSSNIKTNILNITNTLIQLKMALKAQSLMIDSIDYYFDKSNMYLIKANQQIEHIPGKITKFKDYIIYTLLYIICVLLMMILIKTYTHR